MIPKRPVLRGLVLLGGLALLALVGHAFWLPGVAQVLIVPTFTPTAADAIVVLGGGSAGEREATGARLYTEGLAPLVMSSGGPMGLPGRPELTFAELSAEALQQQGVPVAAIYQLDATQSTCDEALAVRDWAQATAADRVLVVTDPFHTRRAQVIFQQALAGSGVEAVIVAAAPSWFSAATWWRDPRAIQVVLLEYAKSTYGLFTPCRWATDIINRASP
mgnify:CR=1 FL=1